MANLFDPLQLPNGKVIPNRLCKAAMEENLSDWGQVPGSRLYSLYQQWADGGAGLILTGNVMIAPDALTGPGGIVLENASSLSAFQRWAKIGRSQGAQFWMQINHPGRQVYASMGETSYAPSEVSLEMGNFSKMFATPKALNDAEIHAIIQRFVRTSQLAEQAGFTGVQVHAAHGYLLSQFLSPLVNKREDQWGGDRERRAKMLLDVVDGIRAAVASDFCLSVKLNSADFQKGGFNQEDAKWVVAQLNNRGIDLVELSGGSYESPAMQGGSESQDGGSSSLQREAFFIDFARDIASVAQMPIMVTGGILKRQVAEQALQDDAAGYGVAMLGIARGLALKPDLPNLWREHEHVVTLPEVGWKNKVLAALAVMAVTKVQLNRMAHAKSPNPKANPALALVLDRVKTMMRTRRYRRWRDQTSDA